MNRPNLINIDQFKKKIRNLNKPNITLTLSEVKQLDADIDQLLLYTVDLQATMLARPVSNQPQEDIEVQVGGGDFY